MLVAKEPHGLRTPQRDRRPAHQPRPDQVAATTIEAVRLEPNPWCRERDRGCRVETCEASPPTGTQHATYATHHHALFVAGQLKGHAKAMALGEKELSSGSDEAVKKAAADSAPVIKAHHTKFMAQAKSMGLPEAVDSGLSGAAATSTNQLPAGLIAPAVC